MINELIEKEIEKRIGGWGMMYNLNLNGLKSEYKIFAQIIAKEVAMRFKIYEDGLDENGYEIDGNTIEKLADQIINEVSE